LDDYVIGQDRAKVALSVAVHNHYKRIGQVLSGDIEIQKSNIMLIGSTGVGKTLLASTLAKVLDVPFCIADSTTYTEAGYEGESVEGIVKRLISNADNDIELAQKGIVYLDETDKMRKHEGGRERDVSGEGVQQALLKIIEGTVVDIDDPNKRFGPGKKIVQFDTSDVLFICGGSFVGLDEIVNEESDKRSMGFGADVKKKDDSKGYLVKPRQEHLVKYGIIPEFIGRVPVIVTLDDLREKDIVKILTKPKNALVKQYQELLSMDGIKLRFTAGALDSIAQKAVGLHVGARGLRSVIEDIMNPVMYDLPQLDGIKECVVGKACVTEGKKPIYKFK
jgi:ATP-dependent Clp protease ATP-binding subunit ClpX